MRVRVCLVDVVVVVVVGVKGDEMIDIANERTRKEWLSEWEWENERINLQGLVGFKSCKACHLMHAYASFS